MGSQVSRSDFEWSYTDEPHASRRKEILAKYPQIKKLMGVDPAFKYQVLVFVFLQLATAYLCKDLSWLWLFVSSYAVGAFFSNALLVSLHEISHNAAYGNGRLLANRLFGFVANLPLGIPCSVSFKKWHTDHHRYLGDADMDPDLPTKWEARFFCNTLTKVLYVFLIPFFYSLRPVLVNPKKPLLLEIVNAVIQLSFDGLVVYLFGVKYLVFLVASTLLSMGLHPGAGHYIAEHYMFIKGQETFSYYGPLNLITFNVGYHNEHHDFPSVPGSRLPILKKIAPEYYDTLPHHDSWIRVIYEFITDPTIGPYARIKRHRKGKIAEKVLKNPRLMDRLG